MKSRKYDQESRKHVGTRTLDGFAEAHLVADQDLSALIHGI